MPKTPRAPPCGCARGIKFHNGAPVTSDDVKWSYEHYHGAWAGVLDYSTDGVGIPDDHTVRFDFKIPFLDFPWLIGTANVCGAGWVVTRKRNIDIFAPRKI